MQIVNIQNAKTHLSRLVEEAIEGADIVIAKGGKPLVRLTPFQKMQVKRQLGLLAGKGHENPGCWDPDPELEASFYGEAAPSTRLKGGEES